MTEIIKENIGERYYETIKASTSLLSNDISACGNKLVSLITNATPSAIVIRRILRKSALGDEEFDPIVAR